MYNKDLKAAPQITIINFDHQAWNALIPGATV